MAGNQKIRILIADDHPLVRSGIRKEVTRFDDLVIVAEVKNGREAVNLSKTLNPELIILDLHMPGQSPLDTLKQLNELTNPVHIIILTADDSIAVVRQMLSLGVKGFVMKEEPIEVLMEAIRTVHMGGIWFSHHIENDMRDWILHSLESCPESLTSREMEVLGHLIEGMPTGQIAKLMKISSRTVRYHIEQICRKLQAKNKTEAVVKTLQSGLANITKQS
jgi:DNA-binding NarL/FixJ family response regulator